MSSVVLVVFCGTNHLDHVFCVIQDKGHWLRIDGAYGRPYAELLGPTSLDIAARFRTKGCTVIESTRAPARYYAPVMPATCVEIAKRILGISRFFIITTRQLHRHLAPAHGD